MTKDMWKLHTIYRLTALLLCSAFLAPAGRLDAQNLLVRSTPEAEGLASRHVRDFMDRLMTDSRCEVHSCIIMRHGHVIAEMYPRPWRRDYRQTMYSVSKTFTAAAVGMCIADSLLSLEDSIGRFFPLLLPEDASDTLKAITVRDLLTMQSGLPVDTKMRTYETEWIKAYLRQRPVAMPGTRWAYDSIVTYLLSAIVQEASDTPLMQFLNDRLFLPMGIGGAAWEESPEGVSCGGWGLYIRPEDMARFGQLLLDGGMWNGMRLLPEGWTREMMRVQSVNGRYGFQMWQCQYPGWAEANGSYGQHIFVVPEADMVVTLTQCNSQRTSVAKWIKEMLADNCTDAPLAQDGYRLTFDGYTLPTASGGKNTDRLMKPLRLALDRNILGWERLAIHADEDGMTLEITDEAMRTYTLKPGYGTWNEDAFNGRPYHNPAFMNNFSNLPDTWHVASSYGWADRNTLNLRLHWVDWLTSAEVQIRLSGASASLTVRPRDTGKTTSTAARVL